MRGTVAAIYLLREDGAALLQHRDDLPHISHAGLWVPPGGHCHPNEAIEDCARREFLEETEVRLDELHPLARFVDDTVEGFEPLDLAVFWSRYDGAQRFVCHEGQALSFVSLADAERLGVPTYLVELWERAAVAARRRDGSPLYDRPLRDGPPLTHLLSPGIPLTTSLDDRSPSASSAEQLRDLYFSLLRIRLIEERIAKLYPKQQMRCPVHLSIGQEAVAVGTCAALEQDDWAMSGHRSHGHYLAKGGDLKAMLAELYGKVTGCTGGKGGSMHLLDLDAGFIGAVPIVGSTIPIATGTAWASRLQGSPRVVVSYFGEGAAEEGVFHESLNFAQLKKLPILFALENNRYSVYTPLELRQPDRPLEDLARAHGVAHATGDGNDVLEVLRLTREAVTRARAGQGPTLLVFDTYRWMEHCGPADDDDLGYRPPGELSDWRRRDPLASFESTLLEQGVLLQDGLEPLREEIATEIDAAVEFAEMSPFPERELLWADVHGQP
ncbi:MAG TPA: thiamine pyrophosphate-dependent enzyme [Plantibacter sp.]|uniref:thiamine pyrophosphate-dependent enzyme n=1 Tax=Plantibacter sp. TaxID=1871045 RepID=UPI002CACC7B6|nr:thiamine pyrophosphate-dependent enzyme [Plantibacter sp.]